MGLEATKLIESLLQKKITGYKCCYNNQYLTPVVPASFKPMDTHAMSVNVIFSAKKLLTGPTPEQRVALIKASSREELRGISWSGRWFWSKERDIS